MKKRLLVLPFFVFCYAYAAEPPKDIKELIMVYEHYDYVCRGTPGMSPDDKVCQIRNDFGRKLRQKGWCQRGSTEDSPAYTYTWQDCSDKQKP